MSIQGFIISLMTQTGQEAWQNFSKSGLTAPGLVRSTALKAGKSTIFKTNSGLIIHNSFNSFPEALIR
jgi:hypothetical protein